MPAHPLSEELLREAVEAHQQHGTVTQAALALGLPRPTLQSRLAQAAVRQGSVRGASRSRRESERPSIAYGC